MSEQTPTTPQEVPPAKQGNNPLLLIVGVVVLGLAAALLFFGGDLFASNDAVADSGEPVSVLDQVSELEPLEPDIAQIQADIGLEVGSAAPDFVLADLEGNGVSLTDFRGQPVIVNFWATWCAPCRLEMPEFQAAHEEHDDLVILALNREEGADDVAAFFDELGLTFTPLLDQASIVANQYEVFNMPTTYFVDSEGIITAVHRGPMTQSQVDGYLETTLGG